MKYQMRTSQALIVSGLVVSSFIGSADAVVPIRPEVSLVESIPTSAIVTPDHTIADQIAVVAAKKTSTLLPVRDAHGGVATDLFAGHSWYTPPPPPPIRARAAPVVREPTAPPLPFSYIGRYEQDGVQTLFYLVKGDRVYDVKVGDVIDDTYTVDRISNGQLMFTYLPLNSSQGLRLGDQ